MSDEAWTRQHVVFERMVRALIDCPVPIIAAVNGAAYGGGCEIAACCDFIYAADTARFALTEVMLGIMPGSAAIDWNLVVFNQLTLKGIYGREMYETWYKMTSLIQSGLDISPVITHRFPYTEFREAIELMKSGNSGKIVLHWSDR